VELLVVMAILGLLALISVPQVIKYLDGAKLSTAKTAVESLSSTLDLLRMDAGRYPTTEEGLDALLSPPAGMTGWNGPYVKKKAQLSDPWGRRYHYRSPGQHGEFDLFSTGPKPEESGSESEPAIANW
jgi:general secretion pathway protein G